VRHKGTITETKLPLVKCIRRRVAFGLYLFWPSTQIDPLFRKICAKNDFFTFSFITTLTFSPQICSSNYYCL